MCGVCGTATWSGDPQGPIRGMLDRLAHRGPDDEGIFEDRQVSLGFRRLSIIDLSGGHQPMEKDQVRLVFNGEIYNYRELRSRLTTQGARFATASDTEVLLEAYRAWGESCVDHLIGMFAFAVWDAPKKRLFMARDRLGIKPLYWMRTATSVAFASELTSLMAHPACRRELSPDGVELYLSLGYVPGTLTVVKDVFKLEPGHALSIDVDSGRTREWRYWDLPIEQPELRLSSTEAAERLRDLLATVVKDHLAADVPVGTFLSGGLDSTAITALMARHYPRDSVPTFSVGFDEAGMDETAYVREAAASLAVQSHVERMKVPGPDELATILHGIDEPIADPTFVANWKLAQWTRQHVKVALSGDGGDELFAGYRKYGRLSGGLPAFLRGLVYGASRLAPLGKTRLRWMSMEPWSRYLEQSFRFYDAPGERLSKQAIAAPGLPLPIGAGHRFLRDLLIRVDALPPLRRMLYLDFKAYLAEDILMKVDKSSMAVGLEVRPPFLDHRFVEFTWSLPPSLLMDRGQSKVLLRSAMKGLVPDSILNRPKQGFNIPLGAWLRGPWQPAAEAWMAGMKRRGLFNADGVQAIWSRLLAGHDDVAQSFWCLLVFEAWCESALDRRSA